MQAGVTCCLGVNVEVALVSFGDGHTRQGEGETRGMAIECARDTVVVVDRIKGCPTLGHISSSILTSRPMGRSAPEHAFCIAQPDLINWLATDHGLAPMDDYQLVTQAQASPLANVGDTNYSPLAKSERWLPASSPPSYGHAPPTPLRSLVVVVDPKKLLHAKNRGKLPL